MPGFQMKTLVSVVVPFYNEEENVPLLARHVDAAFAGLDGYDYECVFVNDGSTDGTRAQLDRLAAENPRIRPVHLAVNRGQSAAVAAGMRRGKGEYLLMFDGDMQNDPCDIPVMLELLQQYDCVCGYRAKRKDTFVRKASSKVANKVRRWVVDDGIRDAGCGSKGFRRACVEHMIPFNGMHRFLGKLMRNAGMTIGEFEATHHPRVHGRSKYGIHNRLWRGIYDLFGVRWLSKRYVTWRVEGE